MPADALKCKECSTDLSAGRALRVRALLRPARGGLPPPDGDAAELKRRIQAGPHSLWRYADFLPLEGPARSALPTGWTPLVKADRLAERLGLGELYIKNETANPTHSFKDRVVSVALARAQELGFETIACASTGNLANAVSRARRRGRAGVLRADPGRPRAGEDPRHRRLRHQHRRHQRQLRRRQPPLHRDRRRPAVGVRQRQPAALLRRGLQDAGVRDRRAARLGDPGPRGRADRLRLAVHQGRPRLPGVHRRRAALRRAAGLQRRPGARLLAGGDRVRGRAPTSAAGQAGHDRQVAGDRQPGRRPVRGRAGAADARRRSTA